MVGPDYTALYAFLGSAAGAAAIVVLAYVLTPGRPGLTEPLPGIADDWSIGDSWATNVGAGAALFTGVLGSGDVLGTILGEGGESLVAMAVVAAAVAAALIGTGPLLLTLLRTFGDYRHTAIGILAASAVVLTGNLGLMWVMRRVLEDNDVVDPALVTVSTVAATLLLIGFALRSIPHTLTMGRAGVAGVGPGPSAMP